MLPASGRPHWPAELFVFRGSPADVSTRLDALAERLAEELVPPVQADRWRLRDVAAHESSFGSGLWISRQGEISRAQNEETLAGAARVRADHVAPVRVAIVASDLVDLAAKVDAARSGTAMAGVYRAVAPERGKDDDGGEIAESGVFRGLEGSPGESVDGEDDGVPEVVFLVPGVGGGVRPGMAADVLVAFPELRGHVLAPDEIEPGAVDVMLPAQAFGDEGRARQQAALDQVAATALTLAQRTLAGAIERFGVVPDHVVVDDADDGSDVAAAVRRLADGGATVFVEVGPGTALTDLVDRTLGDEPHVAVPTDRPGEHGVTTLLHALARLAVAGVPVDVAALHAGRGARPERWADPPRKPGWIINGHFARTAGGASLPKGLRPATEAPPFHIAGGPAPAEPGAATGGGGQANANGNGGLSTEQTAVVMEYLRIVQGVIATGSRIVQGHAQAQAQALDDTATPAGPVR